MAITCFFPSQKLPLINHDQTIKSFPPTHDYAYVHQIIARSKNQRTLKTGRTWEGKEQQKTNQQNPRNTKSKEEGEKGKH